MCLCISGQFLLSMSQIQRKVFYQIIVVLVFVAWSGKTVLSSMSADLIFHQEHKATVHE